MYGREHLAVDIAATVAGLLRLPFLLARWLLLRLWRAFEDYRSAVWNPISATIESGNVEVRRTCLTRALILEFADAELAYSYEVNGNRHSGYCRRSFFDEQRAWNFVDRWKSRQVMIRCHPENFAKSQLRIADQPGADIWVADDFDSRDVSVEALLEGTQNENARSKETPSE
jgi:hypothetical protein